MRCLSSLFTEPLNPFVVEFANTEDGRPFHNREVAGMKDLLNCSVLVCASLRQCGCIEALSLVSRLIVRVAGNEEFRG